VGFFYRNISLWTIHKKKPIHTIQVSHGIAPPLLPEKSSAEKNPVQEPTAPPQPRWVTALAAIPYSNLIFSGSWDGNIRVWKVSANKRKLEAVGAIGGEDSIRGIVNGISVLERGTKKDAKVLVCVATAKEMRLGRWMTVKGRSGGYVLDVMRKNNDTADADGVHMEGVNYV